MDIIYFIIPIALLLVVIAVVGFLWALNSGQFDDLETPAIKALFDEEK